MKRLAALAGAFALVQSIGAPLPLFVNDRFLSEAQNIDATAVLNRGTMNFVSANSMIELDFQNTQYYTNRGTMNGIPGWRFDFTDELGNRGDAEWFINEAGGTVTGSSSGSTAGGVAIQAKNIVNYGTITASSDSAIRIEGDNIDLSRSLTSVSPSIGGNGDFVTEDGFFPEVGVQDMYWGGGEVGVNLGSLMSVSARGQVNIATPSHTVTNRAYQEIQRVLRFGNAKTFFLSNEIAPSNYFYQAIFIRNVDTNVSVDAYWSDENPKSGKTAVVKMTMASTNPVSGIKETRELYIVDTMASKEYGYVVSNLNSGFTFRPTNYRVSKVPLGSIDLNPRMRANLPVQKDLFTTFYGGYFTKGEKYTNQVVTNIYSGYQFFSLDGTAGLGRIPTPNAGTPDFYAESRLNPTNVQGTLSITGKKLNLEKARLQGAGAVVVAAEDLLSSKDSLIDSPILYFNLGKPGGNLTVQNLSAAEVARLYGRVSLFSIVWSNYVETVITNVKAASAAPASAIQGGKGRLASSGDGGSTEPQTEEVTIHYDAAFHVLVIDAQLFSKASVEVNGFVSDSQSTVIKDQLQITDTLKMSSESLTVDGRLILSSIGAAQDWDVSRFPSLNYLTNNGHIVIPGLLNAGADRSAAYKSIVVRGTNVASSHYYRSEDFENRGVIVAGFGAVSGNNVVYAADKGVIELQAKNATFDVSRFEGLGEMSFNVDDLKMRSTSIKAGGKVRFQAANSLRDSGAGADNRIQVTDGFELLNLPKSADLIGTTIETTLKANGLTTHRWPGVDKGATPAGYANNAAVGRLVISGELGSRFRFEPVGAKSAIYVDYLQLSPAVVDNLSEALDIDPNFTIYFANSNVEIPRIDNALGGRLKFVNNVTGPTTSVEVRLPSGAVVKIPRTLRESLIIDSDGDGLANGQDLSPFDGARIASVTTIDKPPLTAVIRWNAAAGATYQLEYSTQLAPTEWKLLKSVKNEGSQTSVISAEDTISNDQATRYYRVRFNPLEGFVNP